MTLTDLDPAPPWEPGIIPTPEQLAVWWQVASYDVLLTAARRALASAKAEQDCFLMNHPARVAEGELALQALARVRSIEPGRHATSGRDFGRGVAHAMRLVQEAARLGPPKRVQRTRTKGGGMPEWSVYVGRPSKWGNEFAVGEECHLNIGGSPSHFVVRDRQQAVHLFERWQASTLPVHELRGRDLACWCPLSEPCHADVLLKLANA